MTTFVKPLEFAQGRNDKPYKHTFLATERILVGMNCLQIGQAQPLHDHPAQDKFYYVLEGTGHFTVGEETRECAAGELILCPAGVAHGVENRGIGLVSFLTVIAPWEKAG